jgi:hypothetical protein
MATIAGVHEMMRVSKCGHLWSELTSSGPRGGRGSGGGGNGKLCQDSEAGGVVLADEECDRSREANMMG